MDETAKSTSNGSCGMNGPPVDRSAYKIDKLVDLIQTLTFTFVAVLVVFRMIGCCELYNLIESRR